MSASARALHRAHTAIGGWLLLGAAAFLLLPWYFLADQSVLQALPACSAAPTPRVARCRPHCMPSRGCGRRWPAW